MYATIMAKIALLFVLVVLNQHEVFEALKLKNPLLRSHYRLYKADVDHLNNIEGQHLATPTDATDDVSNADGGQHSKQTNGTSARDQQNRTPTRAVAQALVLSATSDAASEMMDNVDPATDQLLSPVTEAAAMTSEREAIKPVQVLDDLDGYNGFDRSRLANPFLRTRRVGGWEFGHGYSYRKGVVNGDSGGRMLNAAQLVVTESPGSETTKNRNLLRSGSVVSPNWATPGWVERLIASLRRHVLDARKMGNKERKQYEEQVTESRDYQQREPLYTTAARMHELRLNGINPDFRKAQTGTKGSVNVNIKQHRLQDSRGHRKQIEVLDKPVWEIFQLYGHVMSSKDRDDLDHDGRAGTPKAHSYAFTGDTVSEPRAIPEVLQRDGDRLQPLSVEPSDNGLTKIRPVPEPPTVSPVRDMPMTVSPVNLSQENGQSAGKADHENPGLPLTIHREETVHNIVNEHHFMFRVKGSYPSNKKLPRKPHPIKSVEENRVGGGRRGFFGATESSHREPSYISGYETTTGRLNDTTATDETTDEGGILEMNNSTHRAGPKYADQLLRDAKETETVRLDELGDANLETTTESGDAVRQELIVNKTIEAISRTYAMKANLPQASMYAQGRYSLKQQQVDPSTKPDAKRIIAKSREQNTKMSENTLGISVRKEQIGSERRHGDGTLSVDMTDSPRAPGIPSDGDIVIDVPRGEDEPTTISPESTTGYGTSDDDQDVTDSSTSVDEEGTAPEAEGSDGVSTADAKIDSGTTEPVGVPGSASELDDASPVTAPSDAHEAFAETTEGHDLPSATTDPQATDANSTKLAAGAMWPYSQLTSSVVAGLMGSLSRQQFSWMDVIVAVTCTVAILMLLLNIGLLTQYFFHKRHAKVRFIQAGLGMPPAGLSCASIPDLRQHLEDSVPAAVPPVVEATTRLKARSVESKPTPNSRLNKLLHLDPARILHMESGTSSLTSSGVSSSGISSGNTLSTMIQGDSVHSRDNMMAHLMDDDLVVSLNDQASSCTSLSEGFIYCKDYGEMMSSLETTLQSHPLRKKPLWKRMCFNVDSPAAAALYNETPALSETSSERPSQEVNSG